MFSTKMNGTFSDIDELGSLYFNSKFLAPDELSAKMKKWNQVIHYMTCLFFLTP